MFRRVDGCRRDPQVLERHTLSIGQSPINRFCSTPFRSDPNDDSKPVPGCSFKSFCLFFICLLFSFCKSVTTRIPDPNRSLVYSDNFYLSYQNILFMSFRFRVFNYVEAFSNGRPINIYSYIICLQNCVSFLYKMIHKTIIQSSTLLFTKCHTFKRNVMDMTGYILICCNFLYDSVLLDLAFFPVYSKPAHR